MGAAFSITNLDSYLINYISSFFWDFELEPLRATCRRLRRALPPSKRRTPKQLVTYAAKHDSVTVLQLCKNRGCDLAHHDSTYIARRIGKYDSPLIMAKLYEWCIPIKQCDVIFGAAKGFRNDWCKAQFGGTNLVSPIACDNMLYGAAAGGNLELIQWFITKPVYRTYRGTCERMLYHAAKHNHEEVCKYVKQICPDIFGDAWSYYLMLRGAAFGGHIDLCRLAKDWTTNRYSAVGIKKDIYGRLLANSIKKDNICGCLLALDMEARGYEYDHDCFRYLTEHASKELCSVLLHYFGILSLDPWELFYTAIGISLCNETICEMILQHIHQDRRQSLLEGLMQHAAVVGNSRLCHFAKQWGAHDFDSLANGIANTELGIEWGAHDFDSLANVEWGGIVGV